MPAVPELHEALAHERRAEIFRQFEPHEASDADHEIRVPGEIDVQVQRIDPEQQAPERDAFAPGQARNDRALHVRVEVLEPGADDGNFEEPGDDPHRRRAHARGSKRRRGDRFGPNIVAVQLDRAGKQAREVQRIGHVRDDSDSVRQVPVVRVDDQMHHAEKNVR